MNLNKELLDYEIGGIGDIKKKHPALSLLLWDSAGW